MTVLEPNCYGRTVIFSFETAALSFLYCSRIDIILSACSGLDDYGLSFLKLVGCGDMPPLANFVLCQYDAVAVLLIRGCLSYTFYMETSSCKLLLVIFR